MSLEMLEQVFDYLMMLWGPLHLLWNFTPLKIKVSTLMLQPPTLISQGMKELC